MPDKSPSSAPKGEPTSAAPAEATPTVAASADASGARGSAEPPSPQRDTPESTPPHELLEPCVVPDQPALAVVVRRHSRPIHAKARREVGELVVDTAHCTEDHCRVLTTEQMADLIANVRTALAAPMRTKPRPPSPHYGALEIEARWADHTCTVSDSRTREPLQSHAEVFMEAFQTINESFQRAPATVPK